MKSAVYIYTLLVLLTLSVLPTGCEVNKSVSGRNISFLYSPDGAGKMAVQYQVLSKSNGNITVMLRMASPTLTAVRGESGHDQVSYSLRYRVYTSYSEILPIDSGYVVKKDRVVEGNFIQDSVTLKIAAGRNYVLDLTCRDLNSQGVDRQYLYVQNPEIFSRQSFKLVDKDEVLEMEPYVMRADSYFVVTSDPQDHLYVNFYSRDFPIASAPFSVISPKPFDFTPDERYSLEKQTANRFKLNVPKNGFYQITPDTTKRMGGTVFFFGNYFPGTKTVNDMLSPLRYITTSAEYNEMAQGDNIKKNIDAYWLQLAGNQDRARKLIEAYYSRVEHANRYFTSYLEGWKSDRGMCYIVFGPPDIVYRSTASERWVYGEDGRYNSLSLIFTKVVNPFTPNDFRLNRSGALKTPWYRAVEFWRQGRVLSYK